MARHTPGPLLVYSVCVTYSIFKSLVTADDTLKEPALPSC